ncbi:MAG: helix-turn-helix transcriptional regulator [Bacilli bacterium]|nr:helix-turn-helix transcriptional regulator [Bacilli bacterium]
MPISYNKLWKLLIDKNLKKTDLILKANISANVLARLGKNEAVKLESLEKICITLGCDIGDILEIVKIDNFDKTGK